MKKIVFTAIALAMVLPAATPFWPIRPVIKMAGMTTIGAISAMTTTARDRAIRGISPIRSARGSVLNSAARRTTA
jgi:hypothetical protein